MIRLDSEARFAGDRTRETAAARLAQEVHVAAGSWEQISGGGGPATREEASARRTIELQPMAVRKVRGQRSEERGQGEHGAQKGQRLAGRRGQQGGKAAGWPGWAWEARS